MNVVKRAYQSVKERKKAVENTAAGLGLAVVGTLPAQAQLDISTTAAAVETDILHVVGTIGAVLLVGAGLAVAYKWGKAAFFG